MKPVRTQQCVLVRALEVAKPHQTTPQLAKRSSTKFSISQLLLICEYVFFYCCSTELCTNMYLCVHPARVVFVAPDTLQFGHIPHPLYVPIYIPQLASCGRWRPIIKKFIFRHIFPSEAQELDGDSSIGHCLVRCSCIFFSLPSFYYLRPSSFLSPSSFQFQQSYHS